MAHNVANILTSKVDDLDLDITKSYGDIGGGIWN